MPALSERTAQTVQFTWRAAVDLNGDQVIYQWLPIGFSSVPTLNAAKDTFLVRTGKQLRTYLGTADSVNLRWAVAAKDPTNPAVPSRDTLTVKIVRGTITGVNELDMIPTSFSLAQNYPNPFNPSTTIRFGLPQTSNVTLRLYDALGREVATLLNEQRPAGYIQVVWNGMNNSGARCKRCLLLPRRSATCWWWASVRGTEEDGAREIRNRQKTHEPHRATGAARLLIAGPYCLVPIAYCLPFSSPAPPVLLQSPAWQSPR